MVVDAGRGTQRGNARGAAIRGGDQRGNREVPMLARVSEWQATPVQLTLWLAPSNEARSARCTGSPPEESTSTLQMTKAPCCLRCRKRRWPWAHPVSVVGTLSVQALPASWVKVLSTEPATTGAGARTDAQQGGGDGGRDGAHGVPLENDAERSLPPMRKTAPKRTWPGKNETPARDWGPDALRCGAVSCRYRVALRFQSPTTRRSAGRRSPDRLMPPEITSPWRRRKSLADHDWAPDAR